MSAARLSPPEKLSAGHDLSGFDSGEPVLDDWLQRRAAQNEAAGASRTYIVCAGEKVAGYYSLAVDKSFQGQGVGAELLRDAVLRSVQAAEIAGIRTLLVHAISDRAKRFYEAYRFISSPVDHMTVMIGLSEAEKILSGKRRR
jgi:ribosomal protein S18 acetylase RimI-like enzyme